MPDKILTFDTEGYYLCYLILKARTSSSISRELIPNEPNIRVLNGEIYAHNIHHQCKDKMYSYSNFMCIGAEYDILTHKKLDGHKFSLCYRGKPEEDCVYRDNL